MKVGLDIYEAAEYIGVHWQTLRRYTERGIIPAGKIGSKRCYHPEVLEKFLRGELNSSRAALSGEKAQ